MLFHAMWTGCIEIHHRFATLRDIINDYRKNVTGYIKINNSNVLGRKYALFVTDKWQTETFRSTFAVTTVCLRLSAT